jgi:hypothetical protein
MIWQPTPILGMIPLGGRLFLEVLAKAAPSLPTDGPYKIEMYIHSEDFR